MGRLKGGKNKKMTTLEWMENQTAHAKQFNKNFTKDSKNQPAYRVTALNDHGETVPLTKRSEFIDLLQKTYEDCIGIVRLKNADYAQEGDPFSNFRKSELAGVPVERGILVRIVDKLSRISNLLDNEAEVKEESISDSISDAINYLAILKVFREMKEV